MRVLLTGDAFGGKFLPALTRPDGGDGVEYPNTLTKALPLTRNIDMIITAHALPASLLLGTRHASIRSSR